MTLLIFFRHSEIRLTFFIFNHHLGNDDDERRPLPSPTLNDVDDNTTLPPLPLRAPTHGDTPSPSPKSDEPYVSFMSFYFLLISLRIVILTLVTTTITTLDAITTIKTAAAAGGSGRDASRVPGIFYYYYYCY